MIKIKRLFKIIVPTVMLLMLALTAHAYNVIDLPENMTFSDLGGEAENCFQIWGTGTKTTPYLGKMPPLFQFVSIVYIIHFT